MKAEYQIATNLRKMNTIRDLVRPSEAKRKQAPQTEANVRRRRRRRRCNLSQHKLGVAFSYLEPNYAQNSNSFLLFRIFLLIMPTPRPSTTSKYLKLIQIIGQAETRITALTDLECLVYYVRNLKQI